ncbi:acyltransferase family protein [Bacillus massilinigeriensis]|uniref:acyltransferase family protein n=1 Tax=Bacillus mediterraneensis TaxID=1805474 RepID=UPI0008F96C48|nr:acyltransferase family protein [Bacillus mediterraneensis]
MIKEWNLLRAIACSSVLLLHALTQTSRIVGHPQLDVYHFSRIILSFATPTFIILSIIILANRYSTGLPENFWAGRIKYIYLPFVFFGIIDALVRKYFNVNLIIDHKILDNILTGKYEGWFVLVIFQFYFLFYLVIRFKPSMKWLFPVSLLIMGWYLYKIRGEFPSLNGLDYLLKISFLAWFGYFTAAFLIGKHYSYLAEKLFKYRWATILLAAGAIGMMYISYRYGYVEISSRRIDLFPLVIALSALILAWGQRLPQSRIVNVISNYSFGIYLLHWQVQRFLSPYTAEFTSSYLIQVGVLFVSSLLISILIIKIVSLLPFGAYLVGRVRKTKPIALNQQKSAIPKVVG